MDGNHVVGVHRRTTVIFEPLVSDLAGTMLLGGIATAARLRVRAVRARYALVIAERTRLSREIHDTLLQSLAALAPELEALATRGPSPEDGLSSELRRLRRQVDRSVRDARESILELRRNPMGTPRLADSLAQLADDIETRHGVRPTVTVSDAAPTTRRRTSTCSCSALPRRR
jgi:signal transduction histidine kinase